MYSLFGLKEQDFIGTQAVFRPLYETTVVDTHLRSFVGEWLPERSKVPPYL